MTPRTVGGNDLEGPRISPRLKAIRGLTIRAPQATTGANATNTRPFFPDPSTLQPVGPSDNSGGLAKSVLEYLFLAVALIIVSSIIFRRLTGLRRMNQPLRAFFHSDSEYRITSQNRLPRNFPRTTGLPPMGHNGLPYPPYPDPHLTGFPAVYLGHNTRSVTGQYVDAGGRRLGDRAIELDHGGELGDKDALPAYDHYGGPPKYVEVEMQTRLFGNGSGRQPPVEEVMDRVADNLDISPRLTNTTRLQVREAENVQVQPGLPNVNPRSPPTNMTTNTGNATDERRVST